MASISFGGKSSGLQVGIQNGPVNFSLQPAPQPILPLSTIPFRRDPDFVDHGSILTQVAEKGSVRSSRVALVGLGGVGKSQLAIEHTYRVREESPETWAFWIHASNSTRFEQSCRVIADRPDIPDRQDGNIFELLRNWLFNEKNGPRVLVLDNLDDDHFLHQVASTKQNDPCGALGQTIWEYFPQSLPGSIIITSRSRQVAMAIAEESDIIAVGPMVKDSAVTLFRAKLGVLSDIKEKDINKLTDALDYMPLAIVQTASYVRQRAPRVSLSQYLEDFQTSDRKKVGLLSNYEGGQLRRDKEAKNVIFTTWQMSFNNIQNSAPSAANLLAL